MSDEDRESSQEYKRSAFCGFNRELFNNLKKRSILCSSSSSSDQSSKGSLWENSGEDELLLESIQQVEAKLASESMSLKSNMKHEKNDPVNVEIITIDASEDEDDEDTLLLTQESLPKDVVNTHRSSDIRQNNQSSDIRKNSKPSDFINKKNQPSDASNNNQPSDVYFNNESSDVSESSKSLDGNENNEPPDASGSTDVSESYRQEIVEITKQIDTLVTQSKAGKKTGLITFTYEHYSKRRVKVVGQKIVSGKLIKTGKHLGLSKEQAELKVVKEMLKLLQEKYFPERTCPDESLEQYEHDLVQYCKESNLSHPEFTPRLMEGKYHVTLVVDSRVSRSGPVNFIKDARAIAARNWLQLHGGNWRQVLDHKNLDEEQSGCLVFKCSGEEENRETVHGDKPGGSRVSIQRDNSDVKIVQSPIFAKKRNKGKGNSVKCPIRVSCDERKGALNTDEQGNSDDVTIIQRSHKIPRYSEVISNEGSFGDVDIFNLYSSKNPQTKSGSLNSKEPSVANVKPKFKFAKKTSVNASPSWLSQEFPHPSPENIPSRFSTKVNNANIYEECGEGILSENSGKDELLHKPIKQVEAKNTSKQMCLGSNNKHVKMDHTNVEIISIDASEDEEEDTILLAEESFPKDVVNTHQSSDMNINQPSDTRENSKSSDFIKQANSDNIRLIEKSPGLARSAKIPSYSRVISNEGPCGDVNISNVDLSKNHQTKMNSPNPKEPTVAQTKPNFKFAKKTSVDDTPSWLSQEFPPPAPESIASDTRFSSKVNDVNISGECEGAFGSRKRSLLDKDLYSSSPEKSKRSCDDVKTSSFKRPRKGSLILESVDLDEQNDVKETSFRFSSKAVELNKILVQRKPFKPTAFVAPLKSKSVKTKNGQKEKASNIFDTSDDPDVIEILKREKAEAKNVTGNAKKGSKFVKGVQKMMQYSQKLGQRKRSRFPDCDDKEFESPAKRQRSFDKEGINLKRAIGVSSTSLSQEIDPLQDSPDSIPMSPSLMISPVLPRKLASLEEDEIDDDVENDSNEYVPDLDELLKLPERPADGSKTKDEILDEFDRQIAERQRLHEEEMARVEADIEAENLKRIQRKLRLKENAKLRNRLETELTETGLRSMFKDNLEYLKDIWSGKVESSRHQAYHKSIRTRHALYYTIITDPFTDDQLDWTLDEISKVWMSTRRDQLDNKEYVWKVILAECFIKFYMDFFNLSKNEAMIRISETPLHKKDRLKEFMSKSDEDESEED